MKKLVQIVAGLNALFQLGVGLLALLSPLAAAGLFKVTVVAPAMMALIRIFGGLYASIGVVAGLVALDPDRDRRLALALAGCMILNVAGDGSAIAHGEMRLDQLGAGMALELALALLLLVRRPPR